MMTENLNRIALITGATGFVGTHLSRRLVEDGWDVHVIVRPGSDLTQIKRILNQITVHEHDGSSDNMLSIMQAASPDIVFHLASLFLSNHQPKDIGPLIASNILFGTQLVEAMVNSDVYRLVNTGTSWQHYQNEDYNPVNLYAATKQAFEDILRYYTETTDLKAISLNLFDTYGPDDPRPKLFHLLNKAAETGEPLDMSPGAQLIDLVHIDDVTDAYIIAAQRLLDGKVSLHERYAVSSGHLMPLNELVQLYTEVTNQAVAVNWSARQYRNREVMVPWNRGQAIEGWSPKVKLEDGFRRVAKHAC
jgi:nucleoside-diphosphate-sugar epimerase